MFTGLVEAVGTVTGLEKSAESAVVTVDVGALSLELSVGESVSLNGCCLTVTSLEGSQARFDVMLQTLKLTSLGRLAVGSRVNLERALKVSDRMGGHVVSGHVDGTAEVTEIVPGENAHLFRFKASKTLLNDMIPQGSVALDGVSLTLVDVNRDESTFSVSIIPHTLEQTLFGVYARGDSVNVETDMMGKYVRLHLERMASEGIQIFNK